MIHFDAGLLGYQTDICFSCVTKNFNSEMCTHTFQPNFSCLTQLLASSAIPFHSNFNRLTLTKDHKACEKQTCFCSFFFFFNSNH